MGPVAVAGEQHQPGGVPVQSPGGVHITAQLHRQLDLYDGIVRKALADGLEGEALDAFCDERVRALFAQLLETHGLADDAEARTILETDMSLNAQGVAFAVKKAQHKARVRAEETR